MIDTASEEEEPRVVSLVCRTLHRVNFASAQNDVAIIRQLEIENPTKEALTGVRITLRAAPPIIREKTWIVDRIAPESEFKVRDISTPLDVERLAGLNEAEVGELEFRVEADGLETIIEKSRIELLARDEWGGVPDMAQILAAFVSPNDPGIAIVLKEAARLLEAAGHDGSLNGYQSEDPGRAYMLAGAIWSAATGLGLSYAEPPASFEREGQKIRGPARITREGLATCLDSTLFLAAAFEAVGLNPTVLFAQDHAWVGVWIHKRDLGHVTEPDVVAVRKAVQAHEFVPIETTLLTRRPSIGFEQAVDEGRRRLSEDRESEFVMAVDIARSRAARIRPLASHNGSDAATDVSEDEVAPAALPAPPDFGLLPGEERDQEPETPKGRIERWQRKLLDLSLRNRLLNYRDSKQTLPFRCLDVAALEDALATGKKFRGLSLKDDDPIGDRTVSPESTQRIEEEVARDAFESGQIPVPLTGQDMNNRFLTLFRRAKSDTQEGGTNTLFLATGFLRWKRTEGDTRTYRAPLLLIPVKLERRSARSDFKIEHHEDGVRINSTLLEFLKRDFELQIPELEGELPRDDSGIDVPLIFEIVRQKVRDVAGFEVVEDVALSTFSFAKYLMWKDLVDRADQLRENRLVRHLIDGPEEAYEKSNDNVPVAPEEIDRRRAPQDLLTPLPADSSQLAAVIAASEGRDFVLIGPPGTGKSQTIANMIAQCLGEGKQLLFVAEKAAALDVVQRRLVASGLGDAVLELHSNKTDRKSVIAQLGRGWDRALGSTEYQWIEVTEELRLSRDRLNAYVMALHAKHSQGFSVFDAVGRVADGGAPFEISYASRDAHDEESYQRLVTLAAELGRTYAVVAEGPALSLIRTEEWSYRWEAEILEAAEAFRISLDDLKRDEHVLARELGLSSEPTLSAKRRARLKELAPRAEQGALDLSSVPDMPSERLTVLAEAFATDVKVLATAKSEAVAYYPLDAVRRMPLEQLDAAWREAQTKVWPVSAFARKRVRKLLQTYVDKGMADPAVDLKALLKMRERDAAMRKSPMAPVAENGGRTDADRSTEATRQAIAFREAVTDLRPDAEDPIRFGSATAELGSSSARGIRDALRTFLAAEEVAAEQERAFTSKGGHVPFGASVADLSAGLATVAAERARLADWARWVEKSKGAFATGLGPLVEALEAGVVEGAPEEAFERAYATWWLPLAMDASEELRRFVHWDHENIIETFGQLDDRAAELAPIEVMRRIAHGLPARDGVPRNSELGTLRHQLGLERPSMPIRTLLASLPETLGKLAPCVLMSPLSVAQYLPAGQAAFDIVIFDEASQITTWDAIGAIARARQTIIVGDPKQLPPTNFFGRADDDDEDLPEVERDMPSILDEVATAGVPSRRLDWHYRSRDEALIAFSNHFYYGDRLVTFPAAATGSEALKFHNVNGTYARGSGRVNVDEAKAIAEMVKRRLTTWLALQESARHTLGVITFNGEQQSLILDLLDEIRRENSRLEWFFADEREEPVIVKNLESIQGDERDVMLFSVTFGPDLAGKLTMNFGALNSPGGEKRLNVAITRARRELHVFSSIRAEQIDLERTRAVGVRDLKAFLDYAERGSIALPSRDEGSLGPAENAFEEAVAEAFRAKGWEVRTQIGVSGFRVDLGVVHPHHAGSYLVGIECDGAQYHSSATARDRDKVRQAVLEGLGWTILRIWSTDWFRNPGSVIERVHTEFERLLEQDRTGRASREAEVEARTTEYDGDHDDGSRDEQPALPVPEHDPELLSAGTTLAGFHIEAGARKFADFASRIIEDLGDNARPYMKSWYNAVRDDPGAVEAGLTDDMDDRATVDAVFSSLEADERPPLGDGYTPDNTELRPERPMGQESASDEEVEPPANNGQDQEIKLNPTHRRTHVVADAVAASRPVPLAELENGNRENDGPENKKEIPTTSHGPAWSFASARENAPSTNDDSAVDPYRFFDADYSPVLRQLISGIVEREGSMPLQRLARRVAQVHGWQRTGRRILEQVHRNLGQAERHTEFETIFVWAPVSHADRVPFRKLGDRALRDVSRAEVASVIDAHTEQLAESEDPILMLSRLLGIARLSKDARAYLSDCARWREENAAPSR